MKTILKDEKMSHVRMHEEIGNVGINGKETREEKVQENKVKEVVKNIVEGKMSIQYPQELPITERVLEIKSYLARQCDPETLEKIRMGEALDSDIELLHQLQTTIVVGETGSGKTTQIPKMVYEITKDLEGKIVCTQPRRIAATSVAKRISEECHTRHGEEVGHKVRFDDSTSKEGTEIKVCTDGMLLQEMKHDPLLLHTCAVVVDEAHERSLNIDFLVGLLKDIQIKRVKKGIHPLQITITSATIDSEKFSAYFGSCPVVNVSGRTHEVSIRNEKTENLHKSIVEHVKTIAATGDDGDILVFLDGEESITRVLESLKQEQMDSLEVLPLHGRLPMQDQERVFKKLLKRKVILATNVAETSLTIPGIGYVIDSGLAKIYEFDTKTGVGSLLTRNISQASAKQRAGRAGRVKAGVCIRLYSEENFAGRPAFTKPEIQRTDLSSVILHMKTTGIENPEDFNFIDPPEAKAFHNAYVTLKDLGAIDEQNAITPVGMRLSKLPLEPRIGKMILSAEKYGCLEDTLTVASLLSVRDPFMRPKEKQMEADEAKKKFVHQESDFLTLLSVWDAWKQLRHDGDKYRFCRENFLSFQSMEEIEKVRKQIVHSLPVEERLKSKASGQRDKDALAKSIASGLIQNLFQKDGRFSYGSGSQSNIYIHPSSALFSSKPDWIVSSKILQTGKTFASVNTRIDPEWMEEIAPQLCQKSYGSMRFDEDKGKVLCTEEVTFKGMTIIERKVDAALHNKEEASEKFIRYLLNYPSSFSFDFLKDNNVLMKELSALHLRTLGKVQKMEQSMLTSHYEKHFQKISSVEGLEQYVSTHGDKELRFRKEDFVSTQQEAKIEEDFPMNAQLYGKKIGVLYPTTSSSEMIPTLVIDKEILLQITEYDTLGVVPGYDGAPTFRAQLGSGKEISGDTVEKIQKRYDEFVTSEILDGMRDQFRAIESKEFTSLSELERSFATIPLEYTIGATPFSKEDIMIYIAPKIRYGDVTAQVYFKKEEAIHAQQRVIEKYFEDNVTQLQDRALDALSHARSNFNTLDDFDISTSSLRRIFETIETSPLLKEIHSDSTMFEDLRSVFALVEADIGSLQEKIVWFFTEGKEIYEKGEALKKALYSIESGEEEHDEVSVKFVDRMNRLQSTIQRQFSTTFSSNVDEMRLLQSSFSFMEEVLVQKKDRYEQGKKSTHKAKKKLNELTEKMRVHTSKITSMEDQLEKFDPRLHKQQRQEHVKKIAALYQEDIQLKETERGLVLQQIRDGNTEIVKEVIENAFEHGNTTLLPALFTDDFLENLTVRKFLQNIVLKDPRRFYVGILLILGADTWENAQNILSQAQWSQTLTALLDDTNGREMDELLLLERWDEVQ